ncbi:S-layer family protein [Leptolyngbya sp. GGD]|uniref:S-layer family protein n=1 Tax=Leptolyngbya sp. GGD TaxID=2997907 RepID=UPI00227D5F59|nr:S-layer family protein [Leptolyngbya sp. GGD]MCY6491433.1 S-layer family protein [Leptolyngbya sp. GGD]
MLRLLISLGLFGSWLMLATQVQAQQITSDGTLGSTVARSGNAFTITNGSAAGSNLFHSFREFSIPTGGSATFDLVNTPNISTIFSRVTGGSVSNIDGMIRTINNSNAVNVFLINPAGILFGSQAFLDISSSFTAATADSILFADGMKFVATSPADSSLLTMSVPIGLQMGRSPGGITIQNTGHGLVFPINPFASSPDRSNNPAGLSVNAGKTLALIGGEISLEGGVLNAPSGKIELGSGSNGIVTLDTASPLQQFGYSNLQQFGNIQLVRQSLVDASGSPAGAIHFQGRNIRLTDGSAALLVNSGSANAGDIRVDATESVELQGIGTSGFPQSLLRADNFGSGNGGNIVVSASQLVLQDGGSLHGFNFGAGKGSNISVNTQNLLQLAGLSPLSGFASSVNTQTVGSGSSGDIHVRTNQLQMLGGAVIGNSTSGTGLGGNTIVHANSIEISGEDPQSAAASVIVVGTFSKTNAGQLTINASTVKVSDGGGIVASTVNDGNGGNLFIHASDKIEVSGVGSVSGLPSRIGARADVLAEPIRKLFGLPNPIDITGNTGELSLNTSRLQVTDGAIVGVDHPGQGNAGNLQINANEIVLDRTGSITAETASGKGGNINLQAQRLLLLRRGSEISSKAGGTGQGGDISINAPIIVAVPMENSDIIANAFRGRGGNITITTQSILGLEFRNTLTPRNNSTNDITASSELDISGTVQVNNVGVDPNSGLIQLPAEIIDPTQQIAATCAANQSSSFVITGRGGVPINPMQDTRHDRPWNDVRDLSHFPTRAVNTKHNAEEMLQPTALMEATTWYRHPKTGKVELVAAQPAKTSSTATCAAKY